MLMALGSQAMIGASPARAGATSAAGLKAVFIVGPASYNTGEYISQANDMAKSAASHGMTVYKVYTPHATWAHVLDVVQGANLLVYLGHGNGWPSPYPPFEEDSKDGLGLNPDHGAGLTAPTDYYGGNHIRAKIHLAANAVVLLNRLCYAEGNAESGMTPEYPNNASDRNVATERVDNFAAAFLAAGAGTVFAWGWPQKIDLPAELATTNKTMDKIFEDPANGSHTPNAWIGTNDYYRDSKRTPGARIHLDPSPTYGHLRALTGNLDMTAAEWRGEPTGPDTTAPVLSHVSSAMDGQLYPAGADKVATLSPNGDGVDDQLVIDRTLSESADLAVSVSAADGTPVRSYTQSGSRGSGTTNWNGKDDSGQVVPDGAYKITLTPRDAAGNVGAPVEIGAEVLTTLKDPKASTAAIDVADGDGLASSVRLSVTLTRDATVTWKIVDSSGHTVQTDLDSAASAAGNLTWTWSGTNDAGATVRDGYYRALVSATTDVGSVTYGEQVFVGPYRARFSDQTPRRGQKVHVSVLNTEPLGHPPKIRIVLPGGKTSSHTMHRVSASSWSYTFIIRGGAATGAMKVSVLGTDTSGHPKTGTWTLRVH